MSVIFLDFDGPIFPEKIHLFAQNNGTMAAEACKRLNLHPMVHYWFADPFAICILNELRKVAPYQLVITSSWAEDRLHNKVQIEALLQANGLEYEFHTDWRTPRDPSMVRHVQIEQWLLAHPEVKDYFIFDDTKSAPDLYFSKTYLTTPILQSNVYLAHEKDGYNYDQFDEMKFRMEQWATAYKKPNVST